MNWLCFVFYLLIFWGLTFGQVDDEDVRRSHERMSQLMQHDGVKRVITADMTNIEKIIKKTHLVVVLFWVDNQKESEKINQKDMEFLELTAQLFQHVSVAVTICEIMSNQNFAMAAGVKYSGMIKIFNKGKVSTYSGQRSPDVLIPYLSKMMEKPLLLIDTKATKKVYDQNDLVKIIAYVAKDSKEYKELASAALSFQPMIPFYVVHDSKLAKTFHLKKLNSLQIIKPHEKSLSMPVNDKFTEESIVKFIEENKHQRLTKMRLENLHDVWSIDRKGYVVPVFANTKTSDGEEFFSLVKSLSKQFEKNNNLTFVWIDPEPFPSMVDYWKASFGINPLQPTIGAVDVHKQTSVWYQRQPDEEYSLKLLKQWLENVLAGNVQMQTIQQYNPPETKPVVDEENNEDYELNKEEL